jgi:hypothetical protein
VFDVNDGATIFKIWFKFTCAPCDEISFMLITSIGTADSVTVLGALREPSTTTSWSSSPLSAKVTFTVLP